ncbi:Hypp4151 [Branchiostoma lanceolatum]|uniref:Hypp4151 protein n=1 Tax=Branchiostoma lanceolatum TaxID=7740 RepID=A0A8K0A708_BRALA|nr:Hypp4151 [Branchiostoma lanceolatum]
MTIHPGNKDTDPLLNPGDHVTRPWVRERAEHPGVVTAPLRMLGAIMNQDLCTKLSPIEEVALSSDISSVNNVVRAARIAWHM